MLEATYICDECSSSLPLELERLIFETLSCDGYDPKQLLNLMLVAKRAHDWIRPILYETYIQSPKCQIFTIQRFPASKIANVSGLVKNLLINDNLPPAQLRHLLSHFPHVHNLALWTNRTDLAQIQDAEEFRGLRVRRLSAFVMDIACVDFGGSAFSRVTHLELIRVRKEAWETWEPLARLPSLTHLLLESPIHPEISHNLLKRCPSLMCLIQLVHAFVVEHWSVERRTELCGGPDHRLVSLEYRSAKYFMLDWWNGTQGQVDTWVVAERIVVARQRKFFVDANFRWLPRDIRWEG